MSFELLKSASDSRARLGVLHTVHGDVPTPIFMPVGTRATVKALSPRELEEDLVTVDQLIAFAESDEGRQVFGAEAAPGVAAHGREIKAAGAKYCDCPACAAAAAILEKKDLLLK